jgi:hypothetical protein
VSTPTKTKHPEAVDLVLLEMKSKRLAFGKRLTEVVNEAHRLNLHDTGHKLHEVEQTFAFEVERLYRKRQ